MPIEPLRTDWIQGDFVDSYFLNTISSRVNLLTASGGGGGGTGSYGAGTFFVTDFGALGDGTGDDQPAFMSAISAAVLNGGGTIIVPPGDYALGAPIAPLNMGTVTGAAEGIKLVGGGHRGLLGLEPGGARLQSTGDFECIGGWWVACEISNMCMDVQGHNAPAIRADISKTTISHNELIGWVGYGMQLCTDAWKADGQPTYLNKIENNHVQQQGGIGIYASYLMWDSYIRFNNIGSTDANIMCEGGPHKIHYNWLDGGTGPKHNIHMANVGHTTEIIGNYMENCQRESILIQRPSWETGDRRLSFKIIGNQILNGGHEAGTTYPAVRIIGNAGSDTGKLVGLIFNNNQFFDDEGGHWGNAIEMQNIQSATIIGNDWSNNGYTYDDPILLNNCTDIQIYGNAGSPPSYGTPIRFSATTATVGVTVTDYAYQPRTLTQARMRVASAPVGSSLVAEVQHWDGGVWTTIGTLTIVSSSMVEAVITLNQPQIVGDMLRLNITSVGSTTAATGVVVDVVAS